MQNGLYASLATSKDLETGGIWLDLDHTRIRLARAGGQNVKYNAAAEKIARDNRRIFEHGLMTSAKGKEILRVLYADTVVLDWLSRSSDGTLDEDGEIAGDDYEGPYYVRGVGQPDGSIGDFTKANVIKAFLDLEDLLIMVKETAESLTAFRKELVADVSGN